MENKRISISIALANRTQKTFNLWIGNVNVGFARCGKVIWIDPRYQSLWDDQEEKAEAGK